MQLSSEKFSPVRRKTRQANLSLFFKRFVLGYENTDEWRNSKFQAQGRNEYKGSCRGESPLFETSGSACSLI